MAATHWVLDLMHSEIQFKVKHLVISTVTGAFKQFEGSAETNGDGFESARIRLSLDVNSVDTNQEQRDQHLKADDFFAAATYPHIVFESTGLARTGADEYKLSGNLTIKDVTKPMTLDVEYGGTATDFYGTTKAGFEVSGKINRKEFGLTWEGITEAGSIVVGEDVKLVASVQFAKQA